MCVSEVQLQRLVVHQTDILLFSLLLVVVVVDCSVFVIVVIGDGPFDLEAGAGGEDEGGDDVEEFGGVGGFAFFGGGSDGLGRG